MKDEIFYKMNEKENEMMKEITEITMTDYEIQGYYIPVNSLVSALYEMLYVYHERENELKEEYPEPDAHDTWWDRMHGV